MIRNQWYPQKKRQSWNSPFASNLISDIKSNLYFNNLKTKKSRPALSSQMFDCLQKWIQQINNVSSHHSSHQQSVCDSASWDSLSADAQMQISCVCCPGSQIISQTKTISAAWKEPVGNKGPRGMYDNLLPKADMRGHLWKSSSPVKTMTSEA